MTQRFFRLSNGLCLTRPYLQEVEKLERLQFACRDQQIQIGRQGAMTAWNSRTMSLWFLKQVLTPTMMENSSTRAHKVYKMAFNGSFILLQCIISNIRILYAFSSNLLFLGSRTLRLGHITIFSVVKSDCRSQSSRTALFVRLPSWSGLLGCRHQNHARTKLNSSESITPTHVLWILINEMNGTTTFKNGKRAKPQGLETNFPSITN